MDIKIPVKLQKQYKDASIWQQLFLLNYYDNKKKIRPKTNKHETLIKDIQDELERLYSLAENIEYFKISSEKNSYLEKIYNIELEVLTSKGDKKAVINMKRNKTTHINQLAINYTNSLFEQYKNIVSVIKNSNYDDAFKCLMLNETLTKIYRLDNKNILIENREINKTTLEHMVFNEEVLKYIYDNISTCDSFPKLYFESILNYKGKVVDGRDVIFEGLNTFQKGKWIKFEGKKKVSEKAFRDNVSALKALVADTIWCTKNEASDHLTFGDFYVFVDNEGKPHIAIKMNGNSIEEVRGILEGQRIEDNYSDVAIEFLTKNKDIPNGIEWINNQKWYEVLKKYITAIEGGTVFSSEQLTDLKKNVFDYKEYRPHGGESGHYIKLINLIIENEYIINHLEKYDTSSNKKLSNLIKCFRVVSKLKKVVKYEDLEKVLLEYYNNEEYALIRDSEDKLYHNIIMDKLKSDEIINLLSSRIEKNGGKLFDKISIKNNKNYRAEYFITNLVNGAFIYKNITNVRNVSEFEKYVQYLYKKESLNEYKIDNLFLGENIKEKIYSKKILSLLSKKVEDNNNVLLSEKDGYSGMLLNLINEAYIYLHIDEIQNIGKISDILSYLYSVDGTVGINHKCKIDDFYFKEEIIKKLNSKNFRLNIARGFNCDVNDVLFVDGAIDCNDEKYNNKILYGRVLLEPKNNIEFKAKAVVGLIAKDRAFDASVDYLKSIIFPNLIYCGNIVLENIEVLNSPNLQQGKKFHFINVRNVECEKLEKTNSLYVSVADKIILSSLKKLIELEIKDVVVVETPSLEEIVQSIKGKNAKFVGFSSVLKIGKQAFFENCEIDSLENLSDENCEFSFEESRCNEIPRSKSVQKRLFKDKTWVSKIINKLKNDK